LLTFLQSSIEEVERDDPCRNGCISKLRTRIEGISGEHNTSFRKMPVELTRGTLGSIFGLPISDRELLKMDFAEAQYLDVSGIIILATGECESHKA
jgi:hypothetical protein